jgi:hypothetical protein
MHASLNGEDHALESHVTSRSWASAARMQETLDALRDLEVAANRVSDYYERERLHTAAARVRITVEALRRRAHMDAIESEIKRTILIREMHADKIDHEAHTARIAERIRDANDRTHDRTDGSFESSEEHARVQRATALVDRMQATMDALCPCGEPPTCCA